MKGSPVQVRASALATRDRHRSGRGAPTALLALVACAFLAPAAGAAPYEPNDAVVASTGPLAAGQTYEAALEAPSDRDFFYFYATAAPTAQVTIAIRNLDPTPAASGLNAAVVDSTGTIDAFAYFLAGGSEASATTALEPGKYFLEVSPASQDPEAIAYSFTTGTAAGAFGSYVQITGRCAAAREAVESVRRDVSRAQGRLQRATARRRQSLFGSMAEEEAARANLRRARARVAAKRRALRVAKRRLAPWCSISQ
jgi:hypothetical protein